MNNNFSHRPSVWQTSQLLVIIFSLTFILGSCVVPQQGEEGNAVVYDNYVPPPWAPPYDDVSAVRYYYFPDEEMYYDVWDNDFWYAGPGGVWVSSPGLPPAYAGIDLSAAFIVLIDRDIDRPWLNHGYYRDNYPRHGYDNYKDIVVRNRIITNIAPGHEVVPRAFNENNNRVTFMQRTVTPQPPPPGLGDSRSGQPPPGHPTNPAPPHPPTPPPSYRHVVHEVPMRAISPSMPAKSQSYNYGRGYTKGGAGNSKGGGGKK